MDQQELNRLNHEHARAQSRRWKADTAVQRAIRGLKWAKTTEAQIATKVEAERAKLARATEVRLAAEAKLAQARAEEEQALVEAQTALEALEAAEDA